MPSNHRHKIVWELQLGRDRVLFTRVTNTITAIVNGVRIGVIVAVDGHHEPVLKLSAKMSRDYWIARVQIHIIFFRSWWHEPITRMIITSKSCTFKIKQNTKSVGEKYYMDTILCKGTRHDTNIRYNSYHWMVYNRCFQI